MRIRGNAFPTVVCVETYAPMRGYAEVRLRENINEITTTEGAESSSVQMFEYDEYILHIKNRDGLQAEIEANVDEWLATARSIEVTGNESLIKDMEAALAELGVV